ncbi:hypothetical protein WR25_06347 [Diploscapter pachys]|uniref:Uncharacterized protein n=1 Tax=Diploscapter pachys TaxID=2018661 RepID=A0A2A2K4H9_9BILA|nr:hypothetical protein WR25_06347 [Diploscapter pachys]
MCSWHWVSSRKSTIYSAPRKSPYLFIAVRNRTATTAALQQSLTLAKRSHSDANLNETNNANSSQAFGKLPRIKSEFIASSSLMMFAELAAQESVKLKMKEAFEKLSTATSAASICSGKLSSSLPMVRTNSGNILVRPEPHKLASYRISPLTSPNIRVTEVKKYSGKVENSTLQVSSVPLVQPIVLPINTSSTSGPSYSVSRILGVSNKINTSLNHNNSGPFQVVKKENSFE